MGKGIDRTITHWTAGGGMASSVDKKHYHRITQRDGSVVRGTEEIEDNIVTSDGDYAAHTRNLNTGSAGMAMAGMMDAVEYPFDPGPSPITRDQFEAHCRMLAEFHEAWGIPVTRRTCLTHAEVQPTLGVRQRGKWDLTRLPFELGIVGALPVGDYMRSRVKSYLQNPIETVRPILREGDRGAFVLDLQALLADAARFAGKLDGRFGPRTKAAVMAFQSENGLYPDGVVGPNTWSKLMSAEAPPRRDVDEEDLRKAGSRTIEVADESEKLTKRTAGTVGGLATVDMALEVGNKVRAAEGILPALQELVVENWLILLIIVVAGLLYWAGPKLAQAVRDIRVDDAQTGANLKR